MVKYKRLFKVTMVLICLLLFIFLCVHFLSKGYKNSYIINKNFKVSEVYTKDQKEEHDNYYIRITKDNINFTYQFYKDFADNNKLVKDILVYQGKYVCILPVLAEHTRVDFVCSDGNIFKNYSDIVGEDKDLDEFVSSTSDEFYKSSYFEDNRNNEQTMDKITYYRSNLPDDYILTLSTLKGVETIIDNKLNSIELFDNDVYKRDLSAFVQNYYITADYSSKQSFRDFYVVNILDGNQTKIQAPDYISFNSYIQGVVDDSVYLYDISNEKQYEINIKNSSVEQVGSVNRKIKYFDGDWKIITTVKANKKLLFKQTSETFPEYEYFYKHGHKLSGFYYLYKKVDDSYEVYRAPVQDINNIKYLFKVNNYQDVVYEEDYVFFKTDDMIKMYSDYTGVKTIVRTSELEFNDNIIFNVYKK